MLTIRKNSSSAIKHICTHCCILCSNDLFLPQSVPLHIPAEVSIGWEVIFFLLQQHASVRVSREWTEVGVGMMDFVPCHQFCNILVCEGTVLRLATRHGTCSQFTWGWTVAEANVGQCRLTARAGDAQTCLVMARGIGSRETPCMSDHCNQHLFQRNFQTVIQFLLTKAPKKEVFVTCILWGCEQAQGDCGMFRVIQLIKKDHRTYFQFSWLQIGCSFNETNYFDYSKASRGHLRLPPHLQSPSTKYSLCAGGVKGQDRILPSLSFSSISALPWGECMSALRGHLPLRPSSFTMGVGLPFKVLCMIH